MSKVSIITDSTAYLPKNILEELSIQVLPLYVIWEEKTYKDNVDITPEEFYRKLQTSKEMPSTSQPSPQDFIDLYQPLIDKKADILSIHISSKLSGTIDSATQAKETLGYKHLEIVDSLSTSMAMGFVVMAAARAAKKGKPLKECRQVALNAVKNTKIYFVVDTLEFLKRGGRIGGASAFLGTALNLKPVLYVHEGRIEGFEKVRTKKKALNRLVGICVDLIGNKKPIHFGIMQAEAENDAKEIIDQLKARYKKEDIFEIVEAGLSPAIGTHTGPGAVAIAFMTSE